jgi:hypothetical protein
MPRRPTFSPEKLFVYQLLTALLEVFIVCHPCTKKRGSVHDPA